jgi:DNA repair protein RadC
MKRIDWNSVSEPVDQLYTKGKSALSDSQLLSIIGQIDQATAQKILVEANYQLSNLAKWSLRDWLRFDGLGIAKASTFLAAFEIGRRRKLEEPSKRFKIYSAVDAYNYMKSYLMDEQVEHFYIILLNRANIVQKAVHISTGGVSGTVCDPKLIFKHALENLSSSILLVHNHPSANLKPSIQDKELTNKLILAAKSLDITILDHIIFTDEGYFSFTEEGLM